MLIKTRDISEQDFGAIKVKDIFSNPNIEGASVAVIRVQGVNRKSKNKKSDLFYFVLEGMGTFTVNEELFEVSPQDLIFVPRNTPYVDSGQMLLLVFSSPRYDASEVEYLE